uniref:Uncharacterized protein n=1 Tax=Hyaloperonospora arabidopsidis (strain Emoy2) TaxID=559515 RepID=M4B194_HYAAE
MSIPDRRGRQERATVYKLLITNQMSGCLVITSCHLPRHSLTTPSFLILLAQDVGRHGGYSQKCPWKPFVDQVRG